MLAGSRNENWRLRLTLGDDEANGIEDEDEDDDDDVEDDTDDDSEEHL